MILRKEKVLPGVWEGGCEDSHWDSGTGLGQTPSCPGPQCARAGLQLGGEAARPPTASTVIHDARGEADIGSRFTPVTKNLLQMDEKT